MYSTTQIARELDFSSCQQLNKLLEKLGIQVSYVYHGRKYWNLTPTYRNKGYETFDDSYAAEVTRPHMQPVMYWTEEGKKFIMSLVEAVRRWEDFFALEPVSGLHYYINKAGRQVVQLIRYNPEEALDGTRAYIPEDCRAQFVKDVAGSKYRQNKLKWSGYNTPTYAVDERDSELCQKWIKWIQTYNKYHVLLRGELRRE